MTSGCREVFTQQHRGRGFEDAAEVRQRDGEGHGWVIDTGMGHHPQELVGTRPGDRPGQGALGQFPQERPCGLVRRARGDLGEDQDVRVDGPQRSAIFHEIEELVPIQDVGSGLERGLPPLDLELERLSLVDES